MPAKVLLVKNMVCRRCLIAVENILVDLAIPFQKLVVGEIHLNGHLPGEQAQALAAALSALGLELIDGRGQGLIEKIKQLVIQKARARVTDPESAYKLSAFLAQNLHHEYTYLSSLFSAAEGRTIENFFMHQRIELVKELLVYNEMSLASIAFEMDYSSVAHLSSQFKQITQLTPSHFKKIGSVKRRLIDQV